MHDVARTRQRLVEQAAAPSHVERVERLGALAASEPALLAMCLVGSFARGTADRISDLDLCMFAADGQTDRVLEQAREALLVGDVLHEFSGRHAVGGAFRKLVFLDFSSVEVHVFERATAFRLKRPYWTVWDPTQLLTDYLVDEEPLRHEDFAAFQHGDEGMIWELLDCIKWLSRGKAGLARHHLVKLGREIEASPASTTGTTGR